MCGHLPEETEKSVIRENVKVSRTEKERHRSVLKGKTDLPGAVGQGLIPYPGSKGSARSIIVSRDSPPRVSGGGSKEASG